MGVTLGNAFSAGPTANGAPAYLHTALGQEVKAQMYTLPRIWKRVGSCFSFVSLHKERLRKCTHFRCQDVQAALIVAREQPGWERKRVCFGSLGR